MARRLSALLGIGLLAGCSFVMEEKTSPELDNIKLAESRIALGLAYLNENQWERARYNLETAVQIAPLYPRSRLSFAHYLQKVGEFEQAELQYIAALKHSPKEGDVQNNYGVFLCRQSRFSEAQRAFARAIALPFYYKLSASYENAALCSLKSGQIEDAKKWFKKALAHEPNRLLSSVQLANMEVEDLQLNEARARLTQLHKQYGYQANTLLIMIMLESKAQRVNEVEKYAHLLALRFPESKEHRQYLANEY